jgi:hypothetical protein
MKKIIVAISAIALFTLACNKADNLPTPESISIDGTTQISSKNGILIFKDQETLNDLEVKMNTMTFEDRIKWEKDLNFESQFTIFEKIAKKEYELQIKPYENKSDNEMQNIPFPGHCIEYAQAINDGIIKEINDDGNYIEYNLSDKSMAKYINRSGLVMVGSTLYHIKENLKKTMTNAKISDATLLINTNSTNNVVKIENISRKTRGSYAPSTGSGWSTSGSYRVSVAATFSIVALNGTADIVAQTMQGFPLKVFTNAQKKNTWGNWNQYWGQEYISGNAYLGLKWSQNTLFTSSPNLNDLINNFNTNNYISSGSNATFTWHPFTGQTNTVAINTMSYATITAANSGYYAFWPQNKPISYNITASLPGGCCGMTVSTSH